MIIQRSQDDRLGVYPTKKLVALIAASMMCSTAWAAEITFNYSPYPPMNFEQNGKIVGISADQVNEMMRRSGVSHEMVVMKWSRAIALAETVPATCVTTLHTNERDARFKWIEPLMTQETLLVGLATTPKPASQKEALQARIGSWNSDSSVDLLKGLGVDKLDLAPTMDSAIEKLKAGRVDFVPLHAATIADLQAQGLDVVPVASLATTVTGMACSLDTSDTIVQALQQSLNAIIQDGTQKEILARYQ